MSLETRIQALEEYVKLLQTYISQDESTFYKKEESFYKTEIARQTTIPIGISDFRSTDILFVDINGLNLIKDKDYTINGSNIVLTTGIGVVGTVVHFVALRCVSVTSQDYSALKGDAGKDGRVQDVLVDGISSVNAQGVADIKTPTRNVTILRAGNAEVTQTGPSLKTFLEGSHKTNTGRFVMIGRGVLKTNRYTSSLSVVVNGINHGNSGTNLTTPITVNPIGRVHNGSAGTTYNVGLAVWAQDDGTTATLPPYNSASLICIDY